MSGFSKVLIANRGEIAIRIARALADLGISSLAVFSEDDASALHPRLADAAVGLNGAGPKAYLDAAQMIAIAQAHGAEAIHPGYGFLSENAGFAEACAQAGIAFIGPDAETLALFGDKPKALELAASLEIPTLSRSDGAVDEAGAQAFFKSLPDGQAMIIKAVAGGGGRGARAVFAAAEIAEAHARCRSEALNAFGVAEVFCEAFLARARHIEVQILGDGGHVAHLFERECSLQRRFQKLVEIAPAPGLDPGLREAVLAAAVRLGEAVGYRGLCTVEFLIDPAGAFYFIEANPRLQVEHTVTEAITGVDLVQAQIRIAQGARLEDLGFAGMTPTGAAIQLRLNLETMDETGAARPASGTLTAYAPPGGPGVRVDGCGFAGYAPSPRFDSLLAKLIVHAPDFESATRRAARALSEFEIAGAATNRGFLAKLLRHRAFSAEGLHTRFLDEHMAELASADIADPLAVLSAVRPAQPTRAAMEPQAGRVAVRAGMAGTVVSLEVAAGAVVNAGQAIVILDAMKMEHVIAAAASGIVEAIHAAPGQTVGEGDLLAEVLPGEGLAGAVGDAEIDLDRIRPDLEELFARRAGMQDEARPEAVARRRKTGQRTARENIADLCDEGTFCEYASLVYAAQRRRRSVEDLIANTPGDGLVGGIGCVNRALFGPERSRTVIAAYDYTVLAGTQGTLNHFKKDRLFQLARDNRLPVVLFGEGGGGRPGDTDYPSVAGFDVDAFKLYGELSGLVPTIAIVSGRCFAGNAALVGASDVIIATQGTNLGMGGPAMIEGGGLGVFRPEEIGPTGVQTGNGVIDVLAQDEREAIAIAKRYLSYFQGAVAPGEAADGRRLRHAIPENRLRVYDMRALIALVADGGSVLELRRDFGRSMITALIRIDGKPVGLIANDPAHLSGAIDSDAADKAARFLQLCDAHDLPVVSMIDTPGIMVGPAAEKAALVRHANRLFVVGASLTVPVFAVIVRKCYGLGAIAMAAGCGKAPMFSLAWPTAEFGGMGLEGAVKLGYRKELEAIADPGERKRAFEAMVARAYEHGKAMNAAAYFEFDEVIDPAETRRWLIMGLDSAPKPPPRSGKKRPCVDSW